MNLSPSPESLRPLALLVSSLCFFAVLPECPAAADSSTPAEALAEKTEATPPFPEFLRWSLSDTDWVSGLPLPLAAWQQASSEELDAMIAGAKRSGQGSNLHRTVEALVLEDDSASRQRAVEILEKLIAANAVEDVNAIVSKHGVEYPGHPSRYESGGKIHNPTELSEQRPLVLNVRDLAYEYALHHQLTGDPASAAQAKAILLRFAEVVGKWPLYDRSNKPHSQNDKAFLAHGNANGIWSIWAPKDLAESLPLLRAYDLMRPQLSAAERQMIEEDFFAHEVALLERIRLIHAYNNMVPYHVVPLARFGLVLERPDYVHRSVEIWDKTLQFSFSPDGMWREVTPSYHQQVADRLMQIFPSVLEGYSDPEGYRHPLSGQRFDNLDLNEMAAARFARIRAGLNVLALPDGTLLALNDAWPKDMKVPKGAKVAADEPGLLGVAGVAKLGAEGMAVYLQFGGLRGHDHHDAMNLVWFAGGREVFGETGYQALPGSDSSRTWHTISASHNTVAVNEETQFQDYKQFVVPDTSTAFAYSSNPPEDGVDRPLAAALPDAVSVANQGRLLLWNGEHAEAQAMEAEQETAYPGVTNLFRRTVVMVPTGEGDGYLVDIFRIEGGRSHDFFLRGGLDAPYTMSFNQKLQPVKKSAYEFMAITEEGPVQLPLEETTRFEDGYEVVSRLGTVLGTEAAKLELLVGNAPAIRRLGRAPVSILRRSLLAEGEEGVDEKLSSTYVWVHAAGKAGKEIQDVKVESEGGNVTVMVDRAGGRDIVFSGTAVRSRFESGGWEFSGRLAYASQRGEKFAGVVFSGEALKHDGIVVAAAQPSLPGLVLSTSNRDAGDEADSLLLRLEEGAMPEGFTPRLAHLDFGEVIRFSIPVESAEVEEGGLRLNLKHGPGFVVDGEGAKMTSSPGWAIKGPVTIQLDGGMPAPPASPSQP